jgi:hypothetical protein
MPIEASLTRPSMKLILLLPLALFGCSDYPASEGNDSEANPIDINIKIENNLNEPADNDTIDVDVDSNSESTIDNSTGIQIYEFNSIL